MPEGLAYACLVRGARQRALDPKLDLVIPGVFVGRVQAGREAVHGLRYGAAGGGDHGLAVGEGLHDRETKPFVARRIGAKGTRLVDPDQLSLTSVRWTSVPVDPRKSS